MVANRHNILIQIHNIHYCNTTPCCLCMSSNRDNIPNYSPSNMCPSSRRNTMPDNLYMSSWADRYPKNIAYMCKLKGCSIPPNKIGIHSHLDMSNRETNNFDMKAWKLVNSIYLLVSLLNNWTNIDSCTGNIRIDRRCSWFEWLSMIGMERCNSHIDWYCW